MRVDEVPEWIEHNLYKKCSLMIFKMKMKSNIKDKTNPFCNSAASVLVAACKCRHIGHHMHREHPGRSTRLLQTRCCLDFYGGNVGGSVWCCHLISEEQVYSSSVPLRWEVVHIYIVNLHILWNEDLKTYLQDKVLNGRGTPHREACESKYILGDICHQ